MNVYLPIAEVSINIFILLGLGVGGGVLSGIFGVGGGFLMTPMLIFLGIPPAVAVGTEANQILASSLSGAMAHWRRGNVDIKMGVLLLGGGVIGSSLGIWLFALLSQSGYIDFTIQISYVVMLFAIGALIFAETTKTMCRNKNEETTLRHIRIPYWIRVFPLKARFRKSKLYTSVIPPVILGILVGVLAAIMGVGGGFIMIPAMIYLLGMPPTLVVGTSLFQIVFVTANTTFLQATVNHTVDIVLGAILISGGVIGAQVGAKLAYRIKGEYFRIILAVLILTIACILLYGLVVTPSSIYAIEGVG